VVVNHDFGFLLSGSSICGSGVVQVLTVLPNRTLESSSVWLQPDRNLSSTDPTVIFACVYVKAEHFREYDKLFLYVTCGLKSSVSILRFTSCYQAKSRPLCGDILVWSRSLMMYSKQLFIFVFTKKLISVGTVGKDRAWQVLRFTILRFTLHPGCNSSSHCCPLYSA
jgi:hypothetical protein